ncbi:MAG: outer membrane protein assembly factor BamA [Planctomycetota bacterium]
MSRAAGRSRRPRKPSSGPLVIGLSILLSGPLGAGERPERAPIRRIQFEGLEKESEAQLLSRLRVQLGEPYDRAKIDSEVANLYRTNKFRSVRARVAELDDGVSITFVVEERPRVSQVVLEGRRALSEKHLAKTAPAMRTKAGGPLSEAQVQQDRAMLLEKYRDAGYIFAAVDATVEPAPDGVKVTFQIKEGTRVRIEAIEFAGNATFRPSRLRSAMQTGVAGFSLFKLLWPGYYKAETLAEDLREIERAYRRAGHFDAVAQLTEVAFNERKDRVTLRIGILEGPAYTFEGYELQGNKVFSRETLLALTRAAAGKRFDQDLVDADVKAIREYYLNRAYIFARVEPQNVFSLEQRSVKVRLAIEEANEISIEEIRIQGNAQTQDRVIRRELEFYPGEKVDWSKFEKSRSNLNRLRLFRDIDYSFEPGSSPSRRDVVVSLEEEPFGNLSVLFGVSTDLGILGSVRFRKNNFDISDFPERPFDLSELRTAFTGAGQTFILELQPGTRYSRYRVQFTEPYIFDTRNALSLSLSHLTLRFDEYDETRSSFSPRISHAFEFDRDFVVSLGGRLEEVQITDLVADASQAARDAKGSSTVIATSASVSYDKTLFEYLEGPYSGSGHSILYEYAGGFLGGDVDFHKGVVSSEFHFPVYTYKLGPNAFHHVISFTNRFGVLEPHSSAESIPIFERFFLGGLQYGVRGFDYRGLGPHESGDPVGGAAMFQGSVEYGLPIAYQKFLRLVAFFDYGNLAPDLGTFELSKMRFAAGGGIRINVPIPGQPIPLVFYLGHPLKKEDEDETRFFLFSIGSPF